MSMPDLSDIDTEDYYIDDTFNMNLFNQKFEEINKQKNKKIPSTLKTKKFEDYTFKEIFFGMKDELVTIYEDLENKEYQINNLTKNHRMLYIGICLVIVAVIFNYIYTVYLEFIIYKSI
jgi:hypothetical protein